MDWKYFESSPFQALAHRGGTASAPENTIAAFEDAVSKGYQYLETDVRVTKDGVAILFHDATTERVAEKSLTVADSSWEELSQVRLDGSHTIATLDEVLERFPTARFNIDAKVEEALPLLIDAIRRFDVLDRVCIASFDAGRVRRAQQKLGPLLCTSPGSLAIPGVLIRALLLPKEKQPYGCIQIPMKLGPKWLARRVVARLQEANLKVHIWTLNDRASMEKAIDIGVDGIISDEVDLLHKVLQERDLW